MRAALVRALAGVSGPQEHAPARVVWQDGTDEVLVHLDSVSVRLERGAIVAGVDLESEQTGRGPVIVVVAVGTGEGSRGLFALTEASARGEPLLSARYGGAVANAVWAAVMALAHAPPPGRESLHDAIATWLDRAADAIRAFEPEEPGAPHAVSVVDGHLCIHRREGSTGGAGRERGHG